MFPRRRTQRGTRRRGASQTRGLRRGSSTPGTPWPHRRGRGLWRPLRGLAHSFWVQRGCASPGRQEGVLAEEPGRPSHPAIPYLGVHGSEANTDRAAGSPFRSRPRVETALMSWTEGRINTAWAARTAGYHERVKRCPMPQRGLERVPSERGHTQKITYFRLRSQERSGTGKSTETDGRLVGARAGRGAGRFLCGVTKGVQTHGYGGACDSTTNH